MSFHKIVRPKGSELVLKQIKTQIMNGELAPGSKISSVEELAKTFGVGRSTIREALSALKAMGYLDIQHGGGTYVRTTLPSDRSPGLDGMLQQAESLKEILEVRKVLETGCAALAASNRTEEDLESLEMILTSMSKHLDDESISELADMQFHLQIATATHNVLLLNMMQSVSQHIGSMMKESRKLWFFGERASSERLLEEHRGIYESIASKDETQAFKRMRAHLAKVEKTLNLYWNRANQ